MDPKFFRKFADIITEAEQETHTTAKGTKYSYHANPSDEGLGEGGVYTINGQQYPDNYSSASGGEFSAQLGEYELDGGHDGKCSVAKNGKHVGTSSKEKCFDYVIDKLAGNITEAENTTNRMRQYVYVPVADFNGNGPEIVRLTDVNGLDDFDSRWVKAPLEKQAEYGYDDPARHPDGTPVKREDGEGLLLMTYDEWYDSIPEHDPKLSTR